MQVRGFFFIFYILLTSCGSLSLKVNSTPSEAEVFLHTKEGSQKLGVTPLQINPEQIENLPEGFTLEISKADHIQQKIMLEKRAISSQSEITVKLEQLIKPEAKLSDPDVKAAIEVIARQVASIQSFLIKKDFYQAEVLTKNLLNNYPYFSVGWNLLGNNYYLQGKYADSVNAYKKALSLEPENKETQLILERLERQPASGGF